VKLAAAAEPRSVGLTAQSHDRTLRGRQTLVANLREQLIDRLAKLGVERVDYPGRDDGFCALRYRGREFAHFHSYHELDLKLSRKLIQSEGLSHPPDSTVHPNRGAGSPWIELRFERTTDLDEIIRLVKVAIGHT
jgi:hypothetical protein